MSVKGIIQTDLLLCLISGLRGVVDENCAHLGYHAASSGNFLPTYRDNL